MDAQLQVPSYEGERKVILNQGDALLFVHVKYSVLKPTDQIYIEVQNIN